MALADNDLLDLLLARKDPQGETDTPEVREVLALMRRPAAAAARLSEPKETPPWP